MPAQITPIINIQISPPTNLQISPLPTNLQQISPPTDLQISPLPTNLQQISPSPNLQILPQPNQQIQSSTNIKLLSANKNQGTNQKNNQGVNESNEQKKKHIIKLLEEIKQYQDKIIQLKTIQNQQKLSKSNIQHQEKNTLHHNNQLNHQEQQQINKLTQYQQPLTIITPNNQQHQYKSTHQQQQQLNDESLKYQLSMLRQQNNLLKEQNDLLKQQSTLKMKINKSDHLIYNQSLPLSPTLSSTHNQTSPLITISNTLQPNHNNNLFSQFQQHQQFPSPVTLQNHTNENHLIAFQNQQNQPKSFIRSNAHPIYMEPNQLQPIQTHIKSNSQYSLTILPQSNSNILKPQNIKRKNAGKILFVRSKSSSQKNHLQQGFLSSPCSLDNYQFPLNHLKRGIQSEPQLKNKKESTKSVISSSLKANSASFIKQKSGSKQKLIKQNAFDKINIMKNSLSQRKFSTKKQQLTQSREKNSKIKKQFQLKIQSNKKHSRPLHNEKKKQQLSDNLNNQSRQLELMKSNAEMLEFNTEKEKIDFQNIGFSSVFTDKKASIQRKPQINFHNVNISELSSFKDFLQLSPKIPYLTKTPSYENTQQDLLSLANQIFPLFNVHSLQSPDTDLNVKKFKNCVFFEINPHHNILWHYDGKIYFGSWKRNQLGEGQKFGEGLEFYPNKYIFQGQFSQGKRNGQGILHLINSTNQSIYIGQFVNGKKQGRGKIIDQMENIYEGEWYDDKRHGLGFYKYSNGDIYEGTFNKGEKQGFGVQKFSNGDLYRGQYKNDKFDGKGQYEWKNTSRYEGQFKQGRRNGQGIWKSSNNIDAEIYQGEYLHDKKDGYGIYRWYNGSYYQGYFKQDKKHGVGKTRYQNGKIAVLEWINGASVKKVEKNHWPDFLRDQNQTTIKQVQKPKLSRPKINTFFSYQETPNYSQPNNISSNSFDIYQQQNDEIFESRQQSYQSYENEDLRTDDKIFTGQQLREAKYQPVGSQLNAFNL